MFDQGEEPIEQSTRIPDIWFDFYVRLLPGVIFMLMNFNSIGMEFANLTFAQILTLATFSYICGFLVQPMSSYFSRIYEEEITDAELQLKNSQIIANNVREQAIQSKQYAEGCGFFSIAILLCLQVIWQEVIASNSDFLIEPLSGDFRLLPWYSFIPLIIFCSMCGMERVRSLVRRKNRAVAREVRPA